MSISSTSIAARKSISGSTARTLRSQVFKYVALQGGLGATIEEISINTDIKLQTVCARRNELGKSKLVIDSGIRRRTSSGRTAIVWVVPGRIIVRAKGIGLI